MPIPADQISSKGWTYSKFLCPFCKTPLLTFVDEKSNQVKIWCGHENCTCTGANEASYAKNEKEAYNSFMSKMQFKNY